MCFCSLIYQNKKNTKVLVPDSNSQLVSESDSLYLEKTRSEIHVWMQLPSSTWIVFYIYKAFNACGDVSDVTSGSS